LSNEQEYIGVLGLGEHSTKFYVNKLNSYYKDLYGGYSTCSFKLLNTDFNQINPFLPSNYDKFLPYLKNQLIELNNMGVSQILIPNITLHIAIDKLELPIELYAKIVHPIKGTIYLLKEEGIDQITIVGTRHTSMSKSFIAYFLKQGIEVRTMNDAHIKQIDVLRLSVYEKGYSPELERELFSIVKEYNNPLLCCTELSMLNKGSFELDLVKTQLEKVFINL
jgi:aspartate racemase